MKVFVPRMIWQFFPRIAAYLPITIFILFASVFFSLLAGIVFYIIRLKKIPVLSPLMRVLMSYMRGTPVITQLFLVYYAVPILLKGIGLDITRLNGMYFVIFTYSVYFGAGVAENLRSSLAAVGTGQFEAAYSIGMIEFTAFRRIIFPQMVVVALPNFANIFMRALKNTSLAFSVGVVEMMSMAQLLGSSKHHFTEAYITVSIIYYGMYLIAIRVFDLVEKSVKKHIPM
jgi:L-cystine transport system permease protein